MQHGQEITSPAAEKPFIIELGRGNEGSNGYFAPTARLVITAALRTSGLLQSLAPEELRSLLLILTFLSPNGDLNAFLPNLAEALRMSPGKAQARMQRLARLEFAGSPLATEVRHESGLVSYALGSQLIAYVNAIPAAPEEPAAQGGFRDEIIAYSREHYATPRAEVEQAIAREYGYEPETAASEAPPVETGSTAERNHPRGRAALELRRHVEALGITTEQATYLLDTYEIERVQRQLAWLPYRRAKNPAAYFIAALENDYREPAQLIQMPSNSIPNNNFPDQEVPNGQS